MATSYNTTPWRIATPGELAQLDDGSLSVCKSRRTYTDARGRSRVFVSLQGARGWTPGTKYLAAPVARDNKGWVRQEMRKERTKRVVRLYAHLVIEKGRLPERDFTILGRVYRPDQQRPDWTVKRLFKEPAVKALVRDEMARIVSARGMSPERVIEEYEAVRKHAMKAGDLRVAKSILDRYAAMLDMKPERQPDPPASTGGFDLDTLWETIE